MFLLKNKPEYQSDEESKESHNDDDDEEFIHILGLSASTYHQRHHSREIPYGLENQKGWDPDKNKPEYQLDDESKESYNDDDDDEEFIHTPYCWAIGISMPLTSPF